MVSNWFTKTWSETLSFSFHPIISISTIESYIHCKNKWVIATHFWGVKILATQITHSLSWNDSGIVVVEIPLIFYC